RLAQALDRTRELVSGLDSFDDRLRERARQQGEAEEQQQGERRGLEEGRQGERQQGRQQGGGQQQGEQQVGQQAQQGGAAGGPSQLGADDVRQFRRELQERQAEAEQIRRALSAEGIDVAPLDETIRRLRELHRANLEDLASVERLQAQIVDGLKEFEYALRRQ